MNWLRGRLATLWNTPWPWERRVLLVLAGLRAALTGGAAIVAWVGAQSLNLGALGGLVGGLAGALAAVLASLLSADFLEHGLRAWLLGYSYNPRVSAAGEWEGWTGATDPKTLVIWDVHKYDVLYYRDEATWLYRPAVWEGDPGTGHFEPESHTRH